MRSQKITRFVGKNELLAAQTTLSVVQRPLGKLTQLGRRQRLKLHHSTAGQQRCVDLERGIFRRRPDQHHRAMRDVRQQSVLLGLVEAMNLVEKQHRVATACALVFSFGNRGPNFFDPGGDGGQSGKPGPDLLREDAGQRRLPSARRAPQNQRRQSS